MSYIRIDNVNSSFSQQLMSTILQTKNLLQSWVHLFFICVVYNGEQILMNDVVSLERIFLCIFDAMYSVNK